MIHGLPGLAADHRMFPEPWSTLPDFVAHDWPAYRGENSLAEVAAKVVHSYNIQDGDVLVGASLGGMVGCEVAKLRKLRALYLVGSAISKSEINRFLALLHPLAEKTPIEWLQFSSSKLPVNLARSFASADPAFIRRMCSAVFEWQGLATTEVPCFRIHGRSDLVILPPKNPDLLVDGGHLISITHPTECIQFIRTHQSHRSAGVATPTRSNVRTTSGLG